MTAGFPAAGPLAAALAIVFASGVLRGLTGFGFAIAAVPLLSVVFAPHLAVGIVVLLQLGIGVLDGPAAWREAYRPPLPWLMAGAALGTPLGMAVLRLTAPDPLRLVVAAAALVALAAVWRGPRQRAEGTASHPALVGLTAGVLNGLAAMPGPPIVAYVLNAPIAAPAGRALLIVIFAGLSLVAAVSGAVLGVIGRPAAVLAVAALPALLAGNWLGSRLFKSGPPSLYRRVALGLLATSAATAAWMGLHGLLASG